ncbi:hypothetical protein OsccyDRAFT_4084 [Leptolyngbyaceae cyanobacterium JSC-12]|nr:hypothetical protein OsccyDRAFT_4084 [Leptolyngbyaceae cyanobacterium JSC-12]
MKLKLTLLVSSAISLGLTCVPATAVMAQSASTLESSPLGLDLKLNPQQRKAIATIGDFALDQIDELISNGLDPRKIDRVESQRRTDGIRQMLSSFRLDDQQKAALRAILQTARQQIKRQMETGK